MRKILSMLMIVFVTFGLFMSDAQAKRFGGGRSFGMQRSASNFSRSFTAPANAAASPTSALHKWAGPLAGLALGGLLGSLFAGHGLMSGVLSMLLVGGLVMLVLGFLRGRFANSNSSQAFASQPNQFTQYQNQFTNIKPVAANTNSLPAGFDETEFLRDAKVKFMRLQAAYDTKNLADLREFTTPEVFGEIQIQFQERQDQANNTEVVSLDAKLLDVSNEPENTIASVEFSGAIREELNGPVAPFNEIWHFQKNNIAQKWLVAGLQQS